VGAPQTLNWDLGYGATQRARYERLFSSLQGERASFEPHWRDLGDYFAPRRTRFWTGDKNKGDPRSQKIYDSTGRFAARTLQSGLHAGLTSPARPWMRLTTPDPKLAEYGPVQAWLHELTQRMLTVFAQSNLYNALPVSYGDFGIFGTAAMSILDDTKDLFRARTYPIGSYVVGMDTRDQVQTFGREYQLTVRQIVEQFGNAGAPLRRGQMIDWSTISLTVKKLWDTGDYEAGVDVRWFVTPNEHADDRKLAARYLPFSSCYWEQGDNRENIFLRQSGFKRFPIMVPRWEITGEDSYGVDCPGMTALPDQKQLQIMEREKGKAIKKMIDPPMVAPTSLRTQKTSILPGDVTYVDVREQMAGFRAAHEVRIDLSHLLEDEQAVRYRIQRAFYEDLFLMLASYDPTRGPQKTAREIEERHEEKLLALGPVLERTNDELLDPLVDRVFQMMLDNGLVETPPDELQGVELKVEYISVMAQAQKLVGVTQIDRFVQSTLPMVEFFPEIRRKININKIVDNYSELLGGDPGMVVPTDEAERAQSADQQAQQAMAAAESAGTMAKGARDLSQAPLEQGGTALDAITRGMGAAV